MNIVDKAVLIAAVAALASLTAYVGYNIGHEAGKAEGIKEENTRLTEPVCFKDPELGLGFLKPAGVLMYFPQPEPHGAILPTQSLPLVREGLKAAGRVEKCPE